MDLCFSGVGIQGLRVRVRQVRALSRMSEKVALVTGSTDGIGLHTLKNLAKMVYVTLVHGRNPE